MSGCMQWNHICRYCIKYKLVMFPDHGGAPGYERFVYDAYSIFHAYTIHWNNLP